MPAIGRLGSAFAFAVRFAGSSSPTTCPCQGHARSSIVTSHRRIQSSRHLHGRSADDLHPAMGACLGPLGPHCEASLVDGCRVGGLERRISDGSSRLADVEKVNARLEDAAITSRALREVSGHWETPSMRPCVARTIRKRRPRSDPGGERDGVDLPHDWPHREDPQVVGDREEALTALRPQAA